MRVGLVTYGSVDTETGGYLYDRQLLSHLAARGDEVEVVSLPEGSYARHLAQNLAPFAIDTRFDVVLQDELCHPSLLRANRRPAWPERRDGVRCPVVALVHVLRSSEHGGSRLRRLYAAAERRYLASVDAVVCNSHATRVAVESLLGRSLPGVVAYPGADHLGAPLSDDAMATRARKAGPLHVVSIANVVPGKGLHDLVSALARLPARSWRLTIAGSTSADPDYAASLEELVARLNVERAVELIGAVPNHAVAGILASGQVLALPSRYEALGIAYLEAMWFGLPVIATTAGGASEIVDDELEGFLVAPGDVDAIARAMRSLVDDRERLLNMGLAAKRRAASHVTWAQSGEVTRDLLCSLAAAAA